MAEKLYFLIHINNSTKKVVINNFFQKFVLKMLKFATFSYKSATYIVAMTGKEEPFIHLSFWTIGWELGRMVEWWIRAVDFFLYRLM